MKCHYIWDKEAGKVHIPGCIGGSVYGPLGCTCRPKTYEEFVEEQYRTSTSKLRMEIKELSQENARLNRIIKNLISPKR